MLRTTLSLSKGRFSVRVSASVKATADRAEALRAKADMFGSMFVTLQGSSGYRGRSGDRGCHSSRDPSIQMPWRGKWQAIAPFTTSRRSFRRRRLAFCTQSVHLEATTTV
jgi:hypothetical protein